MQPKKFRDFVGFTINGIQVLERTDRHDPQNRIIYRCKCHCGIIFETSNQNFYHKKFKSCGCLSINREGKTVNERRKDPKGYWWVYKPGHANSNPKGWIREERLIMANQLGRPLNPNESVRHKNNIVEDNRPDNLEIWEDAIPLSLQKRLDIIDFCVSYLFEYSRDYLSPDAIRRLQKIDNQDIKIESLKNELEGL